MTNLPIEDLQLRRLDVPLAEPYVTSLGRLTRLDAVLCLVRVQGRWLAGEGTALAGYNTESPAKVWDVTRAAGRELDGSTVRAGLRTLQRRCGAAPIARAALATALEQALWPDDLGVRGQRLPLVATINRRDPAGLAGEVDAHLSRGHRTLKLKVGLDVDGDIRRLRIVSDIAAGAAQIRLDANQHYAYADALKLVRAADPRHVELLEQPFAPRAWDLTSQLCAASPIPIMLDEAIASREDLGRARDAGAPLVKFKLMKSGGCTALAEDIAAARAVGLEVIVGNGAASDVGCFAEVVTSMAAGVGRAVESNGFMKANATLLRPGLGVRDGAISVATTRPEVNWDVLDAFTTATWATRRRQKVSNR